MYIRHHVNVHTSSRKSPLFLSVFIQTWIFSTHFRKILKLHEYPSSGSRVVHADGHTGRYEKANSRWSHLSERALTFVVKRGLPGITVSHYIICANNRLPLQCVTQTWQCTVRVFTVHVRNWLDSYVHIGNTTRYQKQAHVLHIILFYFFSSMQQSSEPNDQDLQWHWGSHKATGRGKYSFWNVLHQYISRNGCSLIS